MVNPRRGEGTVYPARDQDPPIQQTSHPPEPPSVAPPPSSVGSSVPRLRTQKYGKRRVPTEASLFAEQHEPAGYHRAYFRAASDLVLPPFTTKRVPVHIPQDHGQLKSTKHCYEVSPANADGTIIADNHVVNYGVLPAVLPAVTGQQAVYAYNNTKLSRTTPLSPAASPSWTSSTPWISTTPTGISRVMSPSVGVSVNCCCPIKMFSRPRFKSWVSPNTGSHFALNFYRVPNRSSHRIEALNLPKLKVLSNS